MMMDDIQTVNGAVPRKKPTRRKKAGLQRARLKVWPREADTITFQEGLLNFRATGGGGQMRNANVQRANIMVPVSAMQQPSAPHVSHAETRGLIER
jgi:hypothetical protein